MRLLRRALEDFDEKPEEKTIELKGPLSAVYTQALNTVYAKTNEETADSVDTSAANGGIGDDVSLESADKKKVKVKVKKNAFHEWLGKKEGDKISDTDIIKGLNSTDKHVKKMAQFAKNAKKWQNKKKKPATEEFTNIVLEQICNTMAGKVALESQQMDVTIMNKLNDAIKSSEGPVTPTNNFTTIYGVNKSELSEDDVVDVTTELSITPDNTEVILVIDACEPGDNGATGSITEEVKFISNALECMFISHGGKVFNNFPDAINYIYR